MTLACGPLSPTNLRTSQDRNVGPSCSLSSANTVDVLLKEMLTNISQFHDSENYAKLSLHPYQNEAIQNFHQHLEQGNNKGFFIAATGTGKTRIFISQIIATNSKAIIIMPSLSLVSQTKDRLNELLNTLGINRSIGVFTLGSKTHGDIVLTTYNSLKAQMNKPPEERKLKLDDYPLVVLDEAHLALTEKANEIIQELAKSKVIIACTATDEYNTKRPKGSLRSVGELLGQDNCFFHYSIDQAIEEGSLSPVHVCMVTTDTSLRWTRNDRRQTRKQLKEITEAEAAEQINKDKLNAMVAEIYQNAVYPYTGKPIFGTQAVTFCAGIEHAKAVSDMFNAVFSEHPYFKNNSITPAAYLSGEMKAAQQAQILSDYRNGKIAMLCGADILVTGIDNPNIESVFNLRPTRSVVMALQRAGRAFRLSKKVENKVACVFEFNWVVEGQVFVSEFLGGNYKLGAIPELHQSNQKFVILRREEVGNKVKNSAQWEINWSGSVRKHTVGMLRKPVEIKVPSEPMIMPVASSSSSLPQEVELPELVPYHMPFNVFTTEESFKLLEEYDDPFFSGCSPISLGIEGDSQHDDWLNLALEPTQTPIIYSQRDPFMDDELEYIGSLGKRPRYS